MRIISKFKDYYDFIGNRFGQDPGIVYMRTKLTPKQAQTPFVVVERGKPTPTLFEESERENGGWIYSTAYVVAGDKVVPLVRISERIPGCDIDGYSSWAYSYEPMTEAMWNWIRGKERHLYRMNFSWGDRSKTWEEFTSKFEDPSYKAAIISLVKRVGAPVFLVTHRQIEENVPIMSEMGVASVVPPEVMWSQIYTTLVSVLRNDPDKAVPVTLDNDARIEKAGFDLKSSFRHPVNKKNPKRT